MRFLLSSTWLIIFLPLVQSNAQVAPTLPHRVEVVSTDKFNEFSPSVSADGNTMIIQSNRNSNRFEDRWELLEYTRDSQGNWKESPPMTAINSRCEFLAGPSLSPEGDRVYFTAYIKGVTKSEDIFYADRLSNNQWSEPKSVGAPVNTSGYEGFPSISGDGNSLYFIRRNLIEPVDPESSEDCFVIFVSTKEPDGKWGTPIELPAHINLGCVRDPKILADNRTLIFSAISPTGKGKFDLFQSRKNTDGTWSSAVPLDFINSSENDQSPAIPASGDQIYFYSNKDIYTIPIPGNYQQLINVTLHGFVRTAQNGFPLSCTLKVINLETSEKRIIENNPYSGSFSIVLAAGARYRIEFFNQIHLKEIREYDFRQLDTYKQVTLDIRLKSTYHATLKARDADLKTPVSGFVQVTDQKGKVVLKDSIRTKEPFTNLSLESGNSYQLNFSAPDYQEVSQALVFDPGTFRQDSLFLISMIHDKVLVSTDIKDITSNKRVKTKVTFTNLDRDEVIIAEAGEPVYVRKGDRYQVVASSEKGYFFASTNVLAGGTSPGDSTQTTKILLTPITEGASLSLNNITFESNSAKLRASSHDELDRVIELMNQNPGIVIEIAAHTDDVGSVSYNQQLSLNRAQSVVNYLVEKGVLTNRFVAKGYGKTKPLIANKTEVGRAQNRRVELIILKN